MTKTIYAIALALVLGTTYAAADTGGEGSNTGCNGQGNPNSPCESSGGNGGGGGNGGNGGNGGVSTNENTNTNSQNQSSTALAGSNSSSRSNASGGSVRSNINVSGGESYSRSGATSNASGGQSTSTGGDGGSSDNSVSIEGDDYNYKYDNDYAASSAASIFAGECQTGMSGQVDAGGFAVVNADQFCQHVKAARVMLDAYNWEMENGSTECTAIEYGYTTPEGQDVVMETLQEVCGSEKAMEYLGEYRHHVEEATGLVRKTETVGFVDTISGYLVRPIAIIAVLILLI